jgi:hypothetical protein
MKTTTALLAGALLSTCVSTNASAACSGFVQLWQSTPTSADIFIGIGNAIDGANYGQNNIPANEVLSPTSSTIGGVTVNDTNLKDEIVNKSKVETLVITLATGPSEEWFSGSSGNVTQYGPIDDQELESCLQYIEGHPDALDYSEAHLGTQWKNVPNN